MNRIVAKTRHISLERRQGPSGRSFYTLTYFDNSGMELGWNVFNDMDRAYRAAIDHIRRMSTCR